MNDSGNGDASTERGTRKHLNGRELDGRIYDAMPAAAERWGTSGLFERQTSVAIRD